MGWMLSSLEEIGLRKDLNVPSIESVDLGFFKKIKAMKKQSKQSQKEKPFKKRKLLGRGWNKSMSSDGVHRSTHHVPRELCCRLPCRSPQGPLRARTAVPSRPRSTPGWIHQSQTTKWRIAPPPTSALSQRAPGRAGRGHRKKMRATSQSVNKTKSWDP